MTAFPALRRKNVESLTIKSNSAVDGAAGAASPTAGGFMKFFLAGAMACVIIAVVPAAASLHGANEYSTRSAKPRSAVGPVSSPLRQGHLLAFH
jgi:hypothetical protein